MKHCPNCNCFMNNESYSYYGIGDWDMDYPASYCELHVCPNCDIQYVDGKWMIPNRFLATEKQQRTILFISSVLGIEPPVPTKTQAWLFISENFDEAKRVKEQQRYILCVEDCYF